MNEQTNEENPFLIFDLFLPTYISDVHPFQSLSRLRVFFPQRFPFSPTSFSPDLDLL